ncbi:hypothetical protein ND748_33560, partial [Frankia sp. AiPs1]|nr:hypothetical protein [Frankia sp. AiPs1]
GPASDGQPQAAAGEPNPGRRSGPGNAMTPWAPIGAQPDRGDLDPRAAADTGLNGNSPGEAPAEAAGAGAAAGAAEAAVPWRRVPDHGVPDPTASRSLDEAPPAAAAPGHGPEHSDPSALRAPIPMAMAPHCVTDAEESSPGAQVPAGARTAGAENLMGAEAWEGSGPVAHPAGPGRPGGAG